MASWFCSKYFLQSRDSLTSKDVFVFDSFQIGHREVFSLWGKNPIDYRVSHISTFSLIGKVEKILITKVCVRALHWIRPCARLFTFLTDRHKGCALQLWSMWFCFTAPYTWSFVLFQRKQSIVWVCLCVYAAIISALKKQWQKSYPLNFLFSLFR